jgi:hypothetical protein
MIKKYSSIILVRKNLECLKNDQFKIRKINSNIKYLISKYLTNLKF